jgi:hypothetical protein
MKRYVSAALAVLVAAACTPQPAQVPPPPVAGKQKTLAHATIFLLPTGNVAAPCRIRTSPQLLEASKDKKEHVIWTIVDGCGGTASNDVAIVFPADNDPLDPTCVRRTGKDQIRCAIKTGADEKAYKYKVTLGGAEEDPELEIVM